MCSLTSSGRATVSSAESPSWSRRESGRRHHCQQTRLQRLLAVTAVAVLLLVACADTHRSGIVAVRASATTSSVDDVGSAAYVFSSVEELNVHAYGLPYAFREVEAAEPQSVEGRRPTTAASPSERAFTETAAEREVVSALRMYAASPSMQRLEASAATPPPLHDDALGAASENVSAASMCAADFTCPRSSVAWASGTFTLAGLLTPHSLTLPVGLQLRLSLCCQYRFNGTLLRSGALYDTFLQELLQASPLQALTAEEKRLLFPQRLVYIVDTWSRKRVYDAAYRPTPEDVAARNDGDGDVLVLTTGVLTPSALQKLLSASPALAESSSSSTRSSSSSGSGGGSGVAVAGRATRPVAAGSSLAGTDVQLRITNRVLKCKCPHILTVVPLLHVRRDTLPPITIAGLGSHCGVTTTQKRTTSGGDGGDGGATTPYRIRRVRGADGVVAFATSFELHQSLPPATIVRWTIRQAAAEAGSDRSVTTTTTSLPSVLRHVRVLPIQLDAAGSVQYSTAASPYFLVQPDVHYTVSVEVSRGPLHGSAYTALNLLLSVEEAPENARKAVLPASAPDDGLSPHMPSASWQRLRVSRSAQGSFVLRLPLNRTWPLPPVEPAPHFGVRRWMRLTNATLQHAEVAAALNPRWWPSTSSSASSANAAAAVAAAGGVAATGGWFGVGRWVGSGTGSGAAPPRNRTLPYYGYWANVPLTDQLRPQHALQVRSNPYTDPSPAGVSLPLFLGRNVVAYMVRDVDDVCDPVVLEGREVWSVQSLLMTDGPLTACGPETAVSALVLRGLYHRMRTEAAIAVTVPNTTWTASVVREGDYRCSATTSGGAAVVVGGAAALPASPDCVAVTDDARDGSGCYAAFTMRERGVYAVVWTVRVAVSDAKLVEAANLDPSYAMVVRPMESENTTAYVVEVRSDPLLVVRRMASYPAVVDVELPMHARRWLVAAPRATGASSSAAAKRGGAVSESAATGRWQARQPVRVITVDEHQRAELDTNAVPNVQQTLPNGTLVFVAQDSGEAVSVSVRVGGVVRAVTYTSRCPDAIVDYHLRVVAFPPAPVVPAYAPIYTEEDCVVLVPPRAVRKDEVAEWRVPPCTSTSGGGGESVAAPFLVERLLSVEEQEEHAYVTTTGDGGDPFMLEDASTQNTTSVAVRPQPVRVLLACGVAVQHRCDVVWTARNVLAAVDATYSLRRCQRPPEVLFHADAHQMRAAYSVADVWALPEVEETFYEQVGSDDAAESEEAETSPSSLSSVAARRRRHHRRHRHVRRRHRRQVIPIAGYAANIGYSFNYTGAQEHFTMHLHSLSFAVAHQLSNTQHDYMGPEDGVLVLRRRVSVSVQQYAGSSDSSSSLTTNTNGDGPQQKETGEAADAFWEAYAAANAADDAAQQPSTASTATTDDEAQAVQRRLRDQQYSRDLDERLAKTYVVVHDGAVRRLRVSDMGNASLYPTDYSVSGSTAVRTAAAAKDRDEFARRGMCVERPGSVAVLSITPRGSVREDERYGTVLPPPPAPAIAVLPFCAPHYAFARFPELSTVYGYDYTWSCPEESVMRVTKYHPTYTVLSHTPELGRHTSSDDSGGSDATLCELALTNHITHTEQRDWFLVQRVYPSPLPTTALVVLSDNAADSLQLVPDTTGAAARLRTARLRPNASTTAHPTVAMEELYSAPANTYPFAKARRVVGKSVVLHVDAPAGSGPARWAMQSLVPTATTSVGSQVLLSEVGFRVLHRHPAAVARGGGGDANSGGSTVHVTGLRTPGLYTVTHTLPDPQNPSVCPPVTLTDMLDVFHARVLEKELFVCGDTAALQAVPLPREIAHEFVGQWEVVALATDEKTVWTAGVNFTGIRFERGTRAETLVHGLPFGVVTMRWAIYRLPPATAATATAATRQQQQQHQQRVLVDFDTVEVYVLTENLPSHRLVTLADQATIFTTSSTLSWRAEDVTTAWGESSAALAGLQLAHHAVLNYSHEALRPVMEALTHDEAGRAQFHTYYGLQPRPGSGALTLRQLPVGTTFLRYDVTPSQSVFGRMVGHTCALRGYYEVERVSAYLTATTTLDHECDGYTGHGRITLCLNTDGVTAAAAASTAAAAGSVRGKGSRRGAYAAAAAAATKQAGALFWQSQVRLVAPEGLEEVVKRGAREVEARSRGRCATPWWVAPSTAWHHPTYTTPASSRASEASPSSSSSSSSAPPLPGRCISFAVQAGRHLSPREVAQPLFVAVPRTSAVASGVGAAAAAAVDGAGGAAPACPFHGDFISSRVIDGAPLAEAGAASTGASSAASASSRTFFGLSQLFHLGLPHTSGGSGRGEEGVHFLPVLQPSSLRRANATMRPMVGLRGVADDVTTELNISGFGVVHQRSVDGKGGSAVEAATVLLRLDLTNPRHVGGYTVASTAAPNLSVPSHHHDDHQHNNNNNTNTVTMTQGSLLHRCVEGTVKGADLLQYWSETNRPDGRVDRTAQEWLDYAHAVQDVPLVCDVLFPSLDHLVEEGYDPSYSPPQPANGGNAASSSSSSSSPADASRGWYGRRSRTPAPRAASSSSSPLYVSLTEMEQQVDRIRRRYRWTADGIDVTGLPADLQSALSHRRITTTQLRAIEAARRSRQAAEEAEQKQQQRRNTGRELENAPSQMSPLERLTRALHAYHGVVPQGGEVAVLRVHLPIHEAFTVPYDLFLRTALHKDVLCGTAVDPPPVMAAATVQPTVANPHSLVVFGRLEVRDAPPLLRLTPPVVKQCEVEGGLPVLTLELSGARFAHDRYTAEDVLLEEVANPRLVEAGALTHPAVGLTACVGEMRRGMNAVVEEGAHKRLYVHLRACPFFKMLTPEEYNEHQDSEALLRRLQFSRYLRVTVRRAIHPDSFLSGPRHGSGGEAVTMLLAAQNVSSTSSSSTTSVAAIAPTSTDASFIVEVRPTLARLHLRSSADMQRPPSQSGTTTTTTAGTAESARDSSSSGGGGDGSWWSRTVGSSSDGARDARAGAATRPTSSPATAAARHAFAPTPARPLLVCESDLRRHGFQLGIELIGDTWTTSVGEESAAAPRLCHGGRAALPRQRSPPNVALINSFSVVEHHSLDSSHHLYLKGGGVYRSHFINYLFTTLLSDPAVLATHTFVQRYNDTFAGIVIPPFSAVSRQRDGAAAWGVGREEEEEGEDADVLAVLHQQQQRQQQQQQQRQQWTHLPHQVQRSPVSPRSAAAATSTAPSLPAVRQFCKVEEVLFAVPGIATECQGCLLADTTFFVAGDLTGVWSPATASAAAAAVEWSNETFTRPLLLPWAAAAAIPREWTFEWVCPAAAHQAMEHMAQQAGGAGGGGVESLSVVMDVVVYRVRSITGEELPAHLRPTVLLSTHATALATVMEQNRAFTRQSAGSAGSWSGRLGQTAVVAAPLKLRVNETAVEAAYTQLTNDVLRHRRHARTTMDYHRDARDTGGLLVVNASVFLKVCAGVTSSSSCTVVSITDALLAVEPPVVPARAGSWLWRAVSSTGASKPRVGGVGSAIFSTAAHRASPLSLVVLAHLVFMAYLCHELLPLLGLIVLRGRGAGGDVNSARLGESFWEDEQRAGLAYTAMAAVFLFFSFAYVPVVWAGLCLVIWTLTLYHSRRPEMVLLFVASVLYCHYLL